MHHQSKEQQAKQKPRLRTYSSIPLQGQDRQHQKSRGAHHGRKLAPHHVIKPPKKHASGVQHTPVQSQPNLEAVRFCALGGLEEIGRNMSVFEYKNEIIIADMGLQFPEEDTPGIDYIIPNITGLQKKRANVKAIIITHGHYDHIGAIPYLVDKLGANIPVYTAAFSKAIITKRQEDFPNAPKLNIHVVQHGEKVRLSQNLEAEFFNATHTIPDSISFMLKTPVGNMVYCSDLKVERDINGTPHPEDVNVYREIAKQGVHTLFLESTNAEKPGASVSEETVINNLDEFFKNAQGRIIIGLFASLITRVVDIFRIAEQHNRKIILNGLSLKNNVQIAQNLGYLKSKKGAIISAEEMNNYPDDRILILTTGAQGESRAGLMKIVNGEHKTVTIKKGDTIIFSASAIPGNERPIQTLKDNLTRQGARVYQTQHVDIHASGHGPSEDLKLIQEIMRPRFFVPIHGMYFMRAANVRLAESIGIPSDHTFLIDNGQILNIYKDGVTVANESLPAYYVMVDGLGVGDVEEVVLRDRMMLAQEGMLVIITTLDRRTGKLLKNPDIISRGFIYLNNNKDLIEEIRKKIKSLITRVPRVQSVDDDYLRNLIRDQIGQYVFSKTKRRPMILPSIIEV
ncbi:MAG: ribonuclease J [Candidatus Pacebacteria bacterium]|nr:ribonuclease J [Candidatus Paceibacterota bacterium]